MNKLFQESETRVQTHLMVCVELANIRPTPVTSALFDFSSLYLFQVFLSSSSTLRRRGCDVIQQAAKTK